MNKDELFSFRNLFYTLPMTWAYAQATQALKAGEVPVGAVVMHKGKLLTQAHNAMCSHKDPMAHAEMLAIRQACTVLDSPYLTDCALYVTLEPCALCAAAMVLTRLPRLYFGAYDPKGGAVDHNARIFDCSLHKPDVYGGIQEQQCGALIKAFFKRLRNPKNL